MAAATPGSFGSKLRAARERRGISLREIANATKISVAALDALERNDISRLPGGIFSRSFVRSYALEVGLEPETTIQEFIAQFPNDSVTAGHPTTQQHGDHEKLESDRRMASTFLKLLALSVPVAGAVLYFSLAGRRSVARRVDPPPPLAAVPPPAKPDPQASAAFVVDVAVSARTTVSAMVDGQRTIEREMQAGEHEHFPVQHEVTLVVPDAGLVSLTLDGADAKPLGNAGESATLHLTAANFKDDLASK
jgi:cytoskeletal protein RodZ